MERCNYLFCSKPALHTHRWKDRDTGEVIATWHWCSEHEYPRYPNKRYNRFREADGSLTQYVIQHKPVVGQPSQ